MESLGQSAGASFHADGMHGPGSLGDVPPGGQAPGPLRRTELPITIDNSCLTHQTSGKDAELTLRLFKVACLAYKPSDIEYRGMRVGRQALIRVRRGMVDKIQGVLAECDLFTDNSLYPRRYFDDLMLEDSLLREGSMDKRMHQTSPAGFLTSSVNKVGFPAPDALACLNQDSSHFLPVLERFEKLKFGLGGIVKRPDQVLSPSRTIEQTHAATSSNFYRYGKKNPAGQTSIARSKLLHPSMSIDVQDSRQANADWRQQSRQGAPVQGLMAAISGPRHKARARVNHGAIHTVANKDLAEVRSKMSSVTVTPTARILRSKRDIAAAAGLLAASVDKTAAVSRGLGTVEASLAHLVGSASRARPRGNMGTMQGARLRAARG